LAKIVGGVGELTINFSGPINTDTNVLYLICNTDNVCELKKLPLDNNQKGSLTIADFGAKQLR